MMTPRQLVFSLIVLTACNLTRGEPLPQWPTATTVRVVQATLIPTFDRQLHDLPTMQATETALPPDCQPLTDHPPALHMVTADIDYAQRTVSVAQTIEYLNMTGDALTQIVLNVEPNVWPGAFTLQNVIANSTDADYELTGRRLIVTLPQVLESGCTLKLELDFRLVVPHVGEGLDAYRGFFGYTARQLNLGHWLPTMAVRMEDEWITREAIPIGEQEVLDAADWDVTIRVTGALDTLQVAAPGEMTETGELEWHFLHPGAREFSLSLSETFNVASQEIESGVVVELYSFNDALIQTGQGPIDSAAYALAVASRSMALYEDLYGPYPYQRMVIVQGDFLDGMEFSGLVFVGGEYFRGFLGEPASYLMIITAHEVAHQWWYASVGNDQAVSPWLDEALATYSEFVFIENDYPDLKDWWWWFRVDRLEPEGFVDSTVYEFPTIRAYINAVYLRGVRMLHALRRNLGDHAFFDWLRRYAEAGAGRMVTPEIFWSQLTPEQWDATAAIRQEYLRQPQMVVIESP